MGDLETIDRLTKERDEARSGLGTAEQMLKQIDKALDNAGVSTEHPGRVQRIVALAIHRDHAQRACDEAREALQEVDKALADAPGMSRLLKIELLADARREIDDVKRHLDQAHAYEDHAPKTAARVSLVLGNLSGLKEEREALRRACDKARQERDERQDKLRRIEDIIHRDTGIEKTGIVEAVALLAQQRREAMEQRDEARTERDGLEEERQSAAKERGQLLGHLSERATIIENAQREWRREIEHNTALRRVLGQIAEAVGRSPDSLRDSNAKELVEAVRSAHRDAAELVKVRLAMEQAEHEAVMRRPDVSGLSYESGLTVSGNTSGHWMPERNDAPRLVWFRYGQNGQPYPAVIAMRMQDNSEPRTPDGRHWVCVLRPGHEPDWQLAVEVSSETETFWLNSGSC